MPNECAKLSKSLEQLENMDLQFNQLQDGSLNLQLIKRSSDIPEGIFALYNIIYYWRWMDSTSKADKAWNLLGNRNLSNIFYCGLFYRYFNNETLGKISDVND